MRIFVILLLLCGSASARRRGRGRGSVESESVPSSIDGIDLPPEWSRAKKREIIAAAEAEKREREARQKRGQPALPMFPTHTTVCNGRPCRPGEGNLKHSMEKTRSGESRFKQWTQPYEHREAYVQSRSRHPPHGADAEHYGGLVAVAKSVATENLVLVTSGDWD